MTRVRVLIVDKSAYMRRILADIVSSHPDLEVVATAGNGPDALNKIKQTRPDVVTMDLELPCPGGLETLQRIMAESPLPVIMSSSDAASGSKSTLKALDAGAVDFILKPVFNSRDNSGGSVEDLKSVLPPKILAAASARVGLIGTGGHAPVPVNKKPVPLKGQVEPARLIIAIGASTGGPKALEAVFSSFSGNIQAAVLISQHMPPVFTSSFAQRLDMLSPLAVKEAENGDRLINNRALIAPGGFHLLVKKGQVLLGRGPRVNFVRPAVDVMLESLVDCVQKVLVVIMTGMGKDGAAGALTLKANKQDTVILAQDPSTALISSMPEALIRTGVCDNRVSLDNLAAEIERYTRVLV